jgi:hypothetical protein
LLRSLAALSLQTDCRPARRPALTAAPATREQAERFFATWNGHGPPPIEIVDTEQVGDQTLIEAVVRGRGSAGGAPIEMRDFFPIENGDQLTIRFREFLDRNEALAAAG